MYALLFSKLLEARRLPAVALVLVLLVSSPSLAELPPENACPTVHGGVTGPEDDDASGLLLREGMILGHDDILRLRKLLPMEIWTHRTQFFHEGMRLEIGPCHRRYPVSEFYAKATESFAGRAELDEEYNLLNYVAGLPFPPDDIASDDPQAGLKWAWNNEYRYRGAGPVGDFRIVDLAGSFGSDLTYKGWFYLIQTAHRADLEESDYTLDVSQKTLFVAGGRFDEPFSVRHLAWTQQRPREADSKFSEPDDTFVYVPTMRKVRRASTGWVDGLYFPSFALSGDSAGGGLPMGDILGGGGAQINPNSGQSAAATLHTSRGMTGLSLRPNAYVWRMIGERDVLALINSTEPGWPTNERRNFGYSGLSFASDRWDVRWAVVIEGALRERNEIIRTVTIYLDYQTLQPLYWITRTDKRRLLEIGVLAHRFTGDVFNYPDWPGGTQTTVFEPVAGAFYNALAGRGGWRRESYRLRSVPFSSGERRFMTSTDALGRGR